MAASQEQRCKGCGLMVQSGYPKCPRCKMPQEPSAQSKRAATQVQGGTVVEAGSQRVTLIAAGLLLGVVVLVLTMGNNNDKDVAPVADAADVERTDEVVATEVVRSAPTNTDQVVGFSGVEKVADPEVDRKAALRGVANRLGSVRLWATVLADRDSDSLVVVTSSSCAEPAMKSELTKSSALLRKVGFETLQCVEKHGALVFELGL